MRYLLVFLILFSSCQRSVDRFPASKTDQSCFEFFKVLAFESNIKDVGDLSEQSLKELFKRLNRDLGYKSAKRFYTQLTETPLEEVHLKEILQKIDKFPKSVIKQRKMLDYIYFSGRFYKKKRIKAISSINELFNSDSTDPFIKRFVKIKRKFDKKENIFFQREMERLLKDKDFKGNKNAVALKRARKFRLETERLSFACKARVKNEEKSAAAKNFRNFILVVGPISTVTGYTIANWDDLVEALEMEDNTELKMWFKQLGYDLGIGILFAYITGKIFSEPTGGYFTKVMHGYYADVAVGVLDVPIYNFFFPKSDEEITKRFEMLKSDPNFDQRIKELHTLFDNKRLYPRIKDQVSSIFKSIAGEEKTISTLDFGEINVEDLEKEEVQDLLMQAIAFELYEESRDVENPDFLSEMVKTGDAGVDRFGFYNAVAPIYHTLNIAVGYWIYNTICMGKGNMGRAYLKAATIYAAWAFGYNLFEFPMRNKMINQ